MNLFFFCFFHPLVHRKMKKVILRGYQRGILITVLPFQSALYTSIQMKAPQEASKMCLASFLF